MMRRSDDPEILVLGGGPAGGTAALYAARIGRRVVLLAGDPQSSLIAANREIDNFPGIPGLDGTQFIETLHGQCRDAGVAIVHQHAAALDIENRLKTITTKAGTRFTAPALIAAMGTRPIRPAIPGLDTFWGRGVSVCAWCDGALFKGASVAVFGGGNTAFTSVHLLSRLARQVHLLLPKRAGTAFQGVQERACHAANVRVWQETEVTALEGNQRLTTLQLRSEGAPQTLPLDGLFLALGQKPRAEFLKPLVDLDAAGYIKADGHGSTSRPGIFAAGDVVSGLFRQLIVACGSGATAALGAEQYLSNQWGS